MKTESQPKLEVGDSVLFDSEVLPYSVISANESFAICTRSLSRQHDSELIWSLVDNGGYRSFKSAYQLLKGVPVYTIVDFHNGVRGPENLVFCMGYEDKGDCDEALRRLTAGESEVSRRNRVELIISEIQKPQP